MTRILCHCRHKATTENATEEVCLFCARNCAASYIYGEGIQWKHIDPAAEKKGGSGGQ